MANPIIQNYLDDQSIPTEKRRGVYEALKSGEANELKLANSISNKYGDKYNPKTKMSNAESVEDRSSPVRGILKAAMPGSIIKGAGQAIGRKAQEALSPEGREQRRAEGKLLTQRIGGALRATGEAFTEGAGRIQEGIIEGQGAKERREMAGRVEAEQRAKLEAGEITQEEFDRRQAATGDLTQRSARESTEAGAKILRGGTEVATAPIAGAVTGAVAPNITSLIQDLDPEKQQKLTGAIQAIEELGADHPIARDLITAISNVAVGGKGTQVAARAGTKAAQAGAKAGSKIISQNAQAISQQIKKMSSKEAKKFLIQNVDQGLIDNVVANQMAKDLGIDLPASAFSSPAKSKLEQTIGQGFFGKETAKRQEKAVGDFTKKVEELQSKAMTSGELGENIVNKFKAVEADRKKVIKDLYGQAEEMIKDGRSVNVDAVNTMSKLDEIIKRKNLSAASSPSEIARLEKIRNGLSNTSLDVQRATLKDIGDMANFDNIISPTTDEKLFRGLYGTLKKDIDTAIKTDLPELKPILEKANKEFADFAALKDRPFAKSIAKLGKTGDVDTLADKLTKTNVSTNEVTQIYSTLGAENKDQIQRKIMSDIMEKAKSSSEGFTATGFSKQLNKIGKERLSALLEPEQIKLLNKLDRVNKLIARSGSVAKGSQTALLQQAMRVTAAPATGGASVLAEFGFSKFLNSKLGQRWLRGFSDKTANKILKELDSSTIASKPKLKKAEGAIPKKLEIEAENFNSPDDFVKSKIVSSKGVKHLPPENYKDFSSFDRDVFSLNKGGTIRREELTDKAFDLWEDSRGFSGKEMGIEKLKDIFKMNEVSDFKKTFFHGTDSKFKKFDPNLSGTQSGTGVKRGHIFLSNKRDVAKSYGKNLIKVSTDIKKPLVLDAGGNPWNDLKFNGKSININELAIKAENMGHDGLIVRNVRDTGGKQAKDIPAGFTTSDTIVAFDTRKLKIK